MEERRLEVDQSSTCKSNPECGLIKWIMVMRITSRINPVGPVVHQFSILNPAHSTFAPEISLTFILINIIPYPEQIVTITQNLMYKLNDDPDLHAVAYGHQTTTFQSLWIMAWPLKLQDKGNGRKTDHSRRRAEEFNRGDHVGGVGWVHQGTILGDQYPTVYGIGVVGFSWTAFKVDGADSEAEPAACLHLTTTFRGFFQKKTSNIMNRKTRAHE